MGYGSQAGQVLFATQAVQGTFPATFGTTHTAMKLRSGSLAANRELLTLDPEIGGGRDTSDAYLGAISFSGDFEFYARWASLPTLLRAAFGTADAPVTATGLTTHTIKPTDSSTLPFLAVEERIGSGLETYNYTDCVVNTLHLEAEANGFLMGTAGLIGAKQVAGATATAVPVWDNTPVVVGTNITITYNGIPVGAKSFSWDMTNNFEDDDFRLGSLFLGELTAKAREVSGSFSIRPANSQLWRQAVYGGSALTTPGGLSVKNALVITCTAYEDIPGATPATKFSLTLTMPKVILEPFAFEPSGDDVIENDIAWRAVRPDPATPIMTAVVKSGTATIA